MHLIRLKVADNVTIAALIRLRDKRLLNGADMVTN